MFNSFISEVRYGWDARIKSSSKHENLDATCFDNKYYMVLQVWNIWLGPLKLNYFTQNTFIILDKM